MKRLLFALGIIGLGAIAAGCWGSGDHEGNSLPTFYGSADHGIEETTFVGGSNGTLIASTDVTGNWTLRDSGTTETIRSLAANVIDNTVLAPLGIQQTTFAFGDNGTIRFSVDSGANWSEVTGQDASDIHDGFAFNGDIVTVGPVGKIQTRVDGTWATQDSGTTENLNGVDSAFGLLFVIGNNGTALYSGDFGETWEEQTTGVSNDLNGVVALNFLGAVAVGDSGTILILSKGITQEVSNTTANLFGVAYDGGRIVAVGDGGAIVSTEVVDGDGGVFGWTVRTSGTTEDLKTITGLNGGGFIAAGTNGIVLWSNDSIDWFEVLPNNNAPLP